ncbi:hypothetical protein BT63DRAFT_192917 [Microthyrium microscopicum]|uniref:Uncharacterized protein n=1 Tax=Microthyrium microscopicum TaxID=703497 RepID=A0A6A6UMG8_9PEZI|nr:hypothetical protein BT63DRAFT_192917 [Microthyrium microscopicum]
MPALHKLVVRDDSSSDGSMTPTMLKLLIALVVLAVVTILLIAGLLILRAVKRTRSRPSSLNAQAFGSEKTSNYRRLTIETMNTTPAYAIQEKGAFVIGDSQPTTPTTPLPEIHITFPDEVDKTGRPQSGRVVVVHMGDNDAVGLAPLEDSLPPYEREGGQRFQSLDLDRIGGLKEKDLEKQWS